VLSSELALLSDGNECVRQSLSDGREAADRSVVVLWWGRGRRFVCV
jgi:hypothetical protein